MENEFGEVVNPPVLKGQEFIDNVIPNNELNKQPKQSSPHTPSSEINRVFEPILAKNMKTLSNIEIEWVIEGILAKNYISLLAAREKMGKTTLLKSLLKSLATGDTFLGLKSKIAKTIVISEEHQGHWTRRLEDLGLADCESIWFENQPFNSRPKQKAWEEYLNKVGQYCEDKNIEVLILDTISSIWPVNDENNASEVQTALIPLVGIAKRGIAVLPLHHYSKAGGIRGSTVLAAVPDLLIDFSKPQGDDDTTKRLIKCRSRFEESPEQLLLDYKDDEYILLGTPQDVARNARLEQVKKVLEQFPDGATVQEVLEKWNVESKKPSRSMLKIYLNELCFTREINQIGEKEIKGGKAFIYSIYPIHGDKYQGFTKIATNEPSNPNNHDIGGISNTQPKDSPQSKLPQEIEEILAK